MFQSGFKEHPLLLKLNGLKPQADSVPLSMGESNSYEQMEFISTRASEPSLNDFNDFIDTSSPIQPPPKFVVPNPTNPNTVHPHAHKF